MQIQLNCCYNFFLPSTYSVRTIIAISGPHFSLFILKGPHFFTAMVLLKHNITLKHKQALPRTRKIAIKRGRAPILLASIYTPMNWVNTSQ